MARIPARRPRRTPTGTPAGEISARLYMAYSQADPVLAVILIAVALGCAWAGCFLLDGSRTAGPHLFYVAIVLGALRFRWPAAVATSCVAGLLAGPLLPADVSSHIAQQPSTWLLRFGIFVAIAVFITVLVSSPETTLRGRLQDAAGSSRLVGAIKHGTIEVFYQPIYRLAEERLVGVEALARWPQPGGNHLSPASFVPMAERTGAITLLDAYVLERAIAQARAWARDATPIKVSVNMSARSLMQEDVAETVARVLAEEGFPAELVQIEITESAFIHDVPAATAQIKALREVGVRIAIDDFGSGYAALSYLQHFPVDVVKLDRSLMASATADDRSQRLLEGVVHLCSLLELLTVAEGVESEDQLSLLREIGVPVAQGFLLGRPAPADAIEALLSAQTPREAAGS